MIDSRFHACILAGGRGTRFWPRSRRRLPKQLLPVVGGDSLLRRTIDRLAPLIPAERVWIFTGEALKRTIRKQFPDVPPEQIIAEPEQRNTGPCIALAARLLLERDPAAVMGVFPSDHLIGDDAAYLETLERALETAARGRDLVVMGIPPRWPETGYGYIEFPAETRAGAARAVRVVGFREKPKLPTAKKFVQAGNFYWNSGQFAWAARTLQEAVERHLPETAAALGALPPRASQGFTRALKRLYPACENVSIDRGVLEKADNLTGFACRDFGWNDVGSWEAVYQLAPKDAAGNASRGPIELLGASGCYVDAPGKFAALVGVKDLIVVDSRDALLICPRSEAQKVSAMVQALESAGWKNLL